MGRMVDENGFPIIDDALQECGTCVYGLFKMCCCDKSDYFQKEVNYDFCCNHWDDKETAMVVEEEDESEADKLKIKEYVERIEDYLEKIKEICND